LTVISRHYSRFLLNILINLIYPLLRLYRLVQSRDDAAVMLYLFEIQGPSLPVLKPFVADLVSADPVFPCRRRYAFKLAAGVDVNPLCL